MLHVNNKYILSLSSLTLLLFAEDVLAMGGHPSNPEPTPAPVYQPASEPISSTDSFSGDIETVPFSPAASACPANTPQIPVRLTLIDDANGDDKEAKTITPAFIQSKLAAASKVYYSSGAYKGRGPNCKVEFVLKIFEHVRDNDLYRKSSCDIYFWGKGRALNGYMNINVPKYYNDSADNNYYGCTQVMGYDGNPTTGLNMVSAGRISGDILWELSHNMGYDTDGNGKPGVGTVGQFQYYANVLASSRGNTLSNGAEGAVCFFRDDNYSGNFFCVNKGQSIDNLAQKNGWNDQISSIAVNGNVKVSFCTDANFQGSCKTINGSTPSLGNLFGRSWNDSISSISVN